jgi:glucose/arabinose dehydrogenase
MSRVAVLCLCATLALACDRKEPPPTPSPQPAPGTDQITGNEPLGWDQLAATATELATFHYLIYVDGAAGTELQGVTCASTPGSLGFPCSARLPTMSPGAHALSISSFVDAGARLESDRSPAINVIVVAQVPASTPADQTSITTVDGVSLRADVVASGLEDPTDLAIIPDGRILIAERAGRIRVFSEGRLLNTPALTLDDVVVSDRGGLLAVATHPQFDRTPLVYTVYTARSGFRLARFRAVGGRLGERAILLDGLAPASSSPAASLRFGPDEKLYVGLDDGGDPDRAGDLGSFNGKVLRLNVDGTTPVDQPRGTPVFASDVSQPRGVGWDTSGALWIVESEILRAPAARKYLLPSGTAASDLAFYRADRVPAFRGNLLIAAGEGRALLRLRLDPSEPTRIVSAERLLQDRFDGIFAVAVSRDGVIYVCSGDALIRLTPYE